MSLPRSQPLGATRTLRVFFAAIVLLFGVSIPLSVYLADRPVASSLPMQERPEYKLGFAAGYALAHNRAEAKVEIVKTGGLCGYAKLVCKK